MARPTTYSGTLVALYLEDEAAPGTFVKYCGLTDHTVSFSKNSNDVTVPDCDNPELAAWVERETESLSLSVSGNGVLAAEALPKWWDFYSATTSKNVRVYVGAADDVTNGYYWEGKMICSSFEPTGSRGTKAEVSVAADSDGEMALVKITA